MSQAPVSSQIRNNTRYLGQPRVESQEATFLFWAVEGENKIQFSDFQTYIVRKQFVPEFRLSGPYPLRVHNLYDCAAYILVFVVKNVGKLLTAWFHTNL